MGTLDIANTDARKMSRFQLASVTVLLLLVFVELVSGQPQRRCVRGRNYSSSTRTSANYRWCSPRCNLRRFPQCANNPECRAKRPNAEATKLHTQFHNYAQDNRGPLEIPRPNYAPDNRGPLEIPRPNYAQD